MKKTCPKCGKQMRLIHGAYEYYWSCPNNQVEAQECSFKAQLTAEEQVTLTLMNYNKI